jgi:hypothetical protein
MLSSQPPPRANPFTAAMTGFVSDSIFVNTPLPNSQNALPSSAVKSFICAMSAPATKARPAPVMMSTRTSWSFSARSTACSSSASTSRLSALSASGLSIVITAMLSFVSYNTFMFLTMPLWVKLQITNYKCLSFILLLFIFALSFVLCHLSFVLCRYLFC